MLIEIIKIWNKAAGFKNRNCQKILLVSIQKSGTHLIFKLLSLFGYNGFGIGEYPRVDFGRLNNKKFVWSHNPPPQFYYQQLEQEKLKIIFNYRDPRDICVSLFNWYHHKNKKIDNLTQEFIKKVYSALSDEDKLNYIIKGERLTNADYPLWEVLNEARGLLLHPEVLKIRYEDLVGVEGGGNDAAQLAAIKSVADYLNIEYFDIKNVAKNLYDKESKTFYKGKINRYKKVFTDKQLSLFNIMHGDSLNIYGYK